MKIVGKIVGALLLAAGIAAIWLWPKARPEVDTKVAVRPVRNMVVSGKVRLPTLRFPGKVRAGERRDLMFEVPGRLVDFKIEKGRQVTKGAVLAKLDTRDFESDVRKAEAAYERSESTLSRMRRASVKGGVSKEDVSKAESDAKTCEAQLAIARKALESCVLKAPYDGIVSDTYPEELDMVSVGQKILTIQSIDRVKFDVSVPEAMVISRRMVETMAGRRAFVVFDSLADKEFDVKFEEFVSQADDRTQTFTATFSMPVHPEYAILPGMSVTLVITGGDSSVGNGALSVPSVAVGADSSGAHFVWKLVPSEKEAHFKVVKQPIVTDMLSGTDFAVKSGLADGDRIVTAGVSMLSEGQIVTLLKE